MPFCPSGTSHKLGEVLSQDSPHSLFLQGVSSYRPLALRISGLYSKCMVS